MEYWKDKIAVVTGASAGIGAETVLALARAGMQVVGLARRKNRIEELAKNNKDVSDKIHAIECDISNMESIKNAFKLIEKQFKIIHVLVNNAGRFKYGHILDEKLPFDEIKATIDVNLTGLAACTREAHRLMKKHEENCYILNVNSVAGHMTPTPLFNFGNIYGATKHALTNFTQALRIELNVSGNRRIRVTNISPGGVETEIFIASEIPKEIMESFKDSPILAAKDIADMIVNALSIPAHINISELTVQATGEAL